MIKCSLRQVESFLSCELLKLSNDCPFCFHPPQSISKRSRAISIFTACLLYIRTINSHVRVTKDLEIINYEARSRHRAQPMQLVAYAILPRVIYS